MMLKALIFVGTASAVLGDVYLHNPRGSNNRNCRNDNNENRRNGDRLFDSQNNNKGGYSCPRSYPFACYKYTENNGNNNQRANCNNKNTNGEGAEAIFSNPDEPFHPDGRPKYGELKASVNDADAPINERMAYHVGSVLPLEWTAQHGCNNPKVHCDMVIQIACEDTLHDYDASGTTKRSVRDGTPINNNDGNNNNDEATGRIPDNENNNAQSDMRFGRHETLTYYNKCKNRERNKGLWTADQNVNNNQGATASRQNPNGNRNGLECPEESEYYPYWHDTPWKDLAILTSDTTRCDLYQAESQNVKAKNECVCPEGENTGNSQLPNNEAACTAEGCTWTTVAAHNVPAPLCMQGAFSRDNHLGNAGTMGTDPIMMNWTIPEWLGGQNFCVLRLRYNMSSADEGETPVIATSALNDKGQNENGKPNPEGAGTPIYDRDNNEVKSYKTMTGVPGAEGNNVYSELGFAVNTNQYGRTFQDRTYTFRVLPKANTAENGADCTDGTMYNLNVRGKRGNIVQAYPSVEYDFVPNKLELTEDDCVHLQWTGSDYNPNRNPNNGEGGPPNPNNMNEGKSDRSNMVQQSSLTNNFPITDASEFKMFSATDKQWRRMTFLDQPLTNTNTNGGTETCLTAEQLENDDINNRQDRERDHRNCGKLSGQQIPHVDIGVVKAGAQGEYKYMSTRNNNFSNRGQKGYLKINPGKVKLSGGAIFGIVAASLVGVAAVGFGGKRLWDAKNGNGTGSKAYLPTSSGFRGGASPTGETKAISNTPGTTVTAKHPYDANEAGELSFKAGAKITVTRKDNSGWWEGRLPNGKTGLFPSNYVN